MVWGFVCGNGSGLGCGSGIRGVEFLLDVDSHDLSEPRDAEM
jgi:hypothetical protein